MNMTHDDMSSLRTVGGSWQNEISGTARGWKGQGEATSPGDWLALRAGV